VERPGAAEKVLLTATALGTVLIVAAVVVFAVTGSGFGLTFCASPAASR
jgi:hypothetical protein